MPSPLAPGGDLGGSWHPCIRCWSHALQGGYLKQWRVQGSKQGCWQRELAGGAAAPAVMAVFKLPAPDSPGPSPHLCQRSGCDLCRAASIVRTVHMSAKISAGTRGGSPARCPWRRGGGHGNRNYPCSLQELGLLLWGPVGPWDQCDPTLPRPRPLCLTSASKRCDAVGELGGGLGDGPVILPS